MGETDVCEIRGDDGQGSRLNCRRWQSSVLWITITLHLQNISSSTTHFYTSFYLPTQAHSSQKLEDIISLLAQVI